MKYYATRISENLSETPEGYLLAIGVPIGRVGEMEYLEGETPLEGKDGKVIVSRDAEELFRAKTIASFEGKPFTIRHPQDFVDKDNWTALAKGVIQNVRRGEGDQSDDLIADILITDSAAISLVKGGMRQLSCGYEAEYVQTGPGTGIQKNIVGNHLALVEEGRAGDAYAITDQKGVFRMKKELADMLKKLFGKTIDEAVAADEKAEKDKKAKAAKDAKAKSKDKKTGDAAHDELVAMCDEFMKSVKDKFGKKEEPAEDEDKEESKDEPASLEERLAKLEGAVAKLLERESKEDEVPVGDEEEEVDDEAEEEEVVVDEESNKEEVGDEDDTEDGFELTGDEKSRVEILSPGMTPTKDFKVDALKAAYKTEDGKKAIDSLTGGKPDFAKQSEMLFVATSELLKAQRGTQLSRAKRVNDFQSVIPDEGAMTAEKMNELNEKHYNPKKA